MLFTLSKKNNMQILRKYLKRLSNLRLIMLTLGENLHYNFRVMLMNSLTERENDLINES